jgi:hypothetical protein
MAKKYDTAIQRTSAADSKTITAANSTDKEHPNFSSQRPYAKQHPPSIGFSYTAVEEVKIELAILSSIEFMKSYGKGYRRENKFVSDVRKYVIRPY